MKMAKNTTIAWEKVKIEDTLDKSLYLMGIRLYRN
jgi:hypothetical protein